MKPLFCTTGSLIIQFDDNATAMDCNNTVSNESYQPLGSLSDFNDEDSSGNWTLAYADLADGDTGVLNSWFIEI